jgi:hypothetical protein
MSSMSMFAPFPSHPSCRSTDVVTKKRKRMKRTRKRSRGDDGEENRRSGIRIYHDLRINAGYDKSERSRAEPNAKICLEQAARAHIIHVLAIAKQEA